MKKPMFSIIMLVYNTKKEFLEFAISSVLNQTFSNYEYIIIDDGSNDETKKILSKYENKATIIHQQNIGMPASRLVGLKHASGNYVMFVDSDDYINPKTLEIYNSIIDRYNSDVVMQDFTKFEGNINNIIKKNSFFNEGVVSKEEVLKQLCLLHANGTCGRAVKRELFDNMENTIDTSLVIGEDVQQSTHVLLNANSFYYTAKNIYYYRIVNEHREYNDFTNLNDSNFLTPVYNMLFKDSTYQYLLPVFKNSAMNSLTYNAFRVCLWSNSIKQRNKLLDDLNRLPITNITKNINKKASFISTMLFNLLTSKNYSLLSIFAKIYDIIYGMQKL